ncbi:MAG: Heptaprenyl diphosphate synthase component I [Spirochaetes bacterium ADurb.Bin110]|nr:MAG: Heptaprenyl diphosphate synthase component I [Spirochaetes bacterium ADurb.Bin110]
MRAHTSPEEPSALEAPPDFSLEQTPSRGQTSLGYVNQADLTALLAAFCFFLSAIEYMLPKPLPFMRIGIANLPILLAVDILPFKWFMVLAATKVVGMSIVSGTLFSYVALFSLCGTMIAAIAMQTTRKLGKGAISLIGVSISGAMASNTIQMLMARYVIFGEAAWLIAPLFLTTGLITGTLMGFFAEFFAENSHWYASARGISNARFINNQKNSEVGERLIVSELATEDNNSDKKSIDNSGKTAENKASMRKSIQNQARIARRERYEKYMEPWIAAVLGAAIAIFFLLQKGIVLKLLYLILFVFWTWISGKRFSLISTFAVIAGIILANLLIPSGRVLFKIGPFVITEFALIDGFSKALTFEGLMYLSKAAIMSGLRFPGRFGAIIAQAFRYYDHIIEYRGKIHPKTIVQDIDNLLQTMSIDIDRKTQD